MSLKKSSEIMPRSAARDPFSLLRQMTSELDRAFDLRGFPSFGWPILRSEQAEPKGWFPNIDVFEKDGRLVTRVDLPGMKREDVKVEATDGQLVISGERKTETEERDKNFYRSEREYGSFCRAVPLPEGVKLDDVKATFADGVLDVSVPMPKQAEAAVRKIEIQEAKPAAKAKAAA